MIDWNSLEISQFSSSNADTTTYEYIRSLIGERMVDRIFDVTKEVEEIAEIGCNCGYITRHELPDTIKKVHLCDSSVQMLKQAELTARKGTIDYKFSVMDEETPTVKYANLFHFHVGTTNLG